MTATLPILVSAIVEESRNDCCQDASASDAVIDSTLRCLRAFVAVGHFYTRRQSNTTRNLRWGGFRCLWVLQGEWLQWDKSGLPYWYAQPLHRKPNTDNTSEKQVRCASKALRLTDYA